MNARYASISHSRPSPHSADASCQLHVPWLDGDTLSMDGAEVRILKKVDDKGLGCFLERHQRLGLYSETLASGTAIRYDLANLKHAE